MRVLLLFLFLTLTFSFSAYAQGSIAELEKQLQAASSAAEKLALTYQLSDLNLSQNPKKALELGLQANRMATDQGNKSMAARTAFLVAQAYEYQKDTRNQEVWLKNALTYAKQAGDSDLIIRSVEKRSQIAVKDRNYRRAYEINQEAFEYFSSKGTSISELENRYALQKAGLEREKRQLESERNTLQEEVGRLGQEKEQLSTEKTDLEVRQEVLVKEKDKAVEEVSKKEEDLQVVSRAKDQAEAMAAFRQEEVALLSRDTLEKRYLIEETRADRAEEQLKVSARNSLILIIAILLVSFLGLAVLLYSRYQSKKRNAQELKVKNEEVEKEKQRSESLLLNILPKSIAEELKRNGKAGARYFGEVSVLFTDFVNFTRIAEQLSPEELVAELDTCFQEFDRIISKYPDLEKIKTIGDAYMVASGLGDRETLPISIIQAALEIQDFLSQHREERIREGKPYFTARSGIHTGPVVAGVVGMKKFAYDIWGDTVNIASRIESQCEPGKVNISDSTFQIVQSVFDCEYRGKVPAKNKGEIDMYYVLAEKEREAVEA
ncbi:MAG: hypothetical protein IPK21_03475 [Haliscomenobacter sp.]|nr:hypothetical protein [Haliscomenobacter sp.]